MKQSIGKKPAIIPTPVLIIGTYDTTGKPNGMTAAWGGVCSSDPLSISFSVQRTRHTYQALLEKKECTISIPSAAYVKEADYFGVTSGRDRDKFADTGLTPVRAPLVNAPYVGEFPIVIECRISRVVDVGVHDLFIAEVVDVLLDDSHISPDGNVDLGDVPFFFYHPLNRSYYKTGEFLMPGFSSGSLFK
ncbi:MAG TPA: flavin reductase family protein [Methanospirillum sp.]|uniref:flavin reductase family protein n=1 Tax=Methanospirillum sp. TaxID=45200 RepID=UPI002C30AAB1|nr:flavin reductase family protein [Methanospirillum sp.]HOJ95429.1 flavin reductase family protein [Methanospirillum sp.]HOL40304.1 flavin reductase family protein [Methanospirillum sp.]HPP78232.1 flavin reductase family protein [Methanospirillum sp.]